MSNTVPQHLLLSDVPVQPGDIVFCLDSHGRFIQWNRQAADAFGYEWPDVQGVPFDAILPRHGAGPDRARFDIDRVMAGNDFSGGLDCRHRDGKPLAIYLYATAGRDEAGSITGVLCIGREVTAFREAGLSNRASEEKFRVLFNLSPDVIVLLDSRGRFVEANDAGLALTRYGPDELAGMIALDLVPEERRRQAEAEFSRVWRHRLIQGVTEIRPRTGGRLQFEYRASLLRLEGRNLVLVVGRDATERVRSVERLRESEQRFRAIFESVRDGLYLETLDGRILEANPAAAEMLGYRPDELLELKTADLVPPESRVWLPQLVQTILANRGHQAEGVNLHRNGSEIPVEISCSLVERAGGADPLVLVAARDITERRAALARLKANEDELRAMAETAMELVRMAPEADLFEHAARGLRRLVPGAAVAVSSIDPAAGRMRVRALVGLPDAGAAALAAAVGRTPAELEFEGITPEVIENFASEKMVEVPGGLHGAMFGMVPEPACRELERELGISGAWSIGLRRGNRVLGNATVYPPTGVVPEAGLVETFASQVSVALDRQQAEAAVSESERRLATLMANLPGMAYRCANDPDWTMEFVSEGSFALTGYRPDELAGSRIVAFGSLIHPNDRDFVWREVQAAVERREPFEITYLITDRDGRERWVWEQGQGVFDKAGELVALEGFINDITARKRAEEALVASREEFSSLLDRSPVGIYRTTPDGRILMANPALVRLLGCRSFDELAARRLDDSRFQPGCDREDFKRRIEAEGEIVGLETTWTRADGSPVYVRENARLVRDANGQPEYYEGTVEDLTERRRAEEEVWRAKERLRTLQDNVPVGLYRTTTDGRFLAANRAAVRMFGYDSEDELKAVGVEAVYADRVERRRMVERLRADGRLDGVEVRARRKDGSEFDALLSVTAIRDAAGAVESCDGAVQDVSDRKRAEAARLESEERYRRLVELSPDGIAVHQDGVIKMVNPAGARTLGYDSPAEMVGLPVLGLVHPDDRVRVVARITGVRERGEPGELAEERFRRKDGSWVWVEVVNAPFTWEGRPAVQVVVRDISERRAARQQADETAELLRTLIDSSPHGFAAIQDKRVVMVNRAWAKLLGYDDPVELVGENYLDRVPDDDRARAAEGAGSAAFAGERTVIETLRLRRRDGGWAEIRAMVSVAPWRGRPALFLAERPAGR